MSYTLNNHVVHIRIREHQPIKAVLFFIFVLHFFPPEIHIMWIQCKYIHIYTYVHICVCMIYINVVFYKIVVIYYKKRIDFIEMLIH